LCCLSAYFLEASLAKVAASAGFLILSILLLTDSMVLDMLELRVCEIKCCGIRTGF
jgi:hypothetical protein